MVELPDKLYFKVGEVSKIAGVPTHVLRFWETEFKNIRPKRTSSGHRLYRKKDIYRILAVKRLLYDKRFTIAGARQYLKSRPVEKPTGRAAGLLSEIRNELRQIRDLLS